MSDASASKIGGSWVIVRGTRRIKTDGIGDGFGVDRGRDAPAQVTGKNGKWIDHKGAREQDCMVFKDREEAQAYIEKHLTPKHDNPEGNP